MAELTLYSSTGEVQASTKNATDRDDLRRHFTHSVKVIQTASSLTMLVGGRERVGGRLESYYVEYEPSRTGTDSTRLVDQFQQFAAEHADVTLVTDPSMSDEAAMVDAYNNRRQIDRYPAPVGGQLRTLDAVEVRAPSHEHALGLAEHTVKSVPRASVAVVGTSDIPSMDEFDVVISIDEYSDSVEPSEATVAAARSLEREAAQEAIRERFETIRGEVRELMISDHVNDQEVRDRVSRMTEPTQLESRASSGGLTGRGSLLPGRATPLRFQLAVGVLLGVLVLAVIAAGVLIVGAADLPSFSNLVPSLPSGPVLPSGNPVVIAIGAAVLVGLLITLTTVLLSRS
jgi:hypothetical protein